jgi:cell division protease FtsH
MANEPSRKDSGRSNAPKQEKPQTSNVGWYLLVAVVLLFVVLAVAGNEAGNREDVKLSEFITGLRNDTYGPQNTHEVTFTQTGITFQSRSNEQLRKEKTLEVDRYVVPLVGIDDQTKKKLTDLLDEKDVTYAGGKLESDWLSIIYFLIIPVLFLIFFIYLMKRMGGAGSAMSFGRSRGRMFAQEDIDITFNDVAGIDEAVEELKEIVEFLRVPGKYQALGGRIPRGVLLVGPPGTGKTLLAKAVAGEAGVPFFSLSGSDFVEMFVGVGAARVRDMFQQAGQRAPAIIFIDELDALGKVRGSGMPGGHDEREQTLNALLVEMDGFSSDQSVIVMAATNRPETLDPALMRPGRFDRNVLVDRPDIKGRELILKVHIKKVKCDESVDLARIAKLTPGFVGADLANLVNEAALLAARRDRKSVSMAEFEEGFERVVAGLEKQSRVLDEEEKTRTAYHECGHALAACSLPHTDPVHKISVIPRGMALGYTMHRPDSERHNKTKSELVNSVCCLLGGIAAEQVVYEETSVGAQNDLQRATDISRRMVTEFGMSPKLGTIHYGEMRTSLHLGTVGSGDTVHSQETTREIDMEVKRIIDECYETVLDIMRDNRDLLEQMTVELLEVEVMDADHLNRILDAHRTGPKLKPGTYAVPSDEDTAPKPDATDDDESPTPAADGA